MHEGTSTAAAISPAEIEAELERILASPAFRKSPRHRRFLKFVVGEALVGAERSIKETLIGVEVFDRPAGYDPGAEPMVRVEAGRLRTRLDEYYKEMGGHDPIHIHLPKGSYVPVFYRNGVGCELEAEPEATSRSHGQSPIADAGSKNGRSVIDGQDVDEDVKAVSQPKKFAALKIMVAIVPVLIAALMVIRILMTDSRPQSGRLEGSTLIITNAKGQELWRKNFPAGFWNEYYEHRLGSLGYGQSEPRRMWFGDLEGKGHSDVLFLYHPGASPLSHSTILICYSDHGKEKWHWTPGRELPELQGAPPIFRIDGFAVLDGKHEAHPRIVVSSSHILWYPQQIAILNADGKLLSEYWHSGHLYNLTVADLDGDGREQVIATGISNGYRQATLIVLDPDHLAGASYEPARPDLQIHGMGIAHERLRLLFPRSDLNRASSLYNQAQEPNVLDGRIEVAVLECQQIARCVILYQFDSAFHLLSAVADDQFRGAHTEFYLRNKPSHQFNEEEEAEFRKVRCLRGCATEFVSLQSSREKSNP
jgi:hypothetical protein